MVSAVSAVGVGDRRRALHVVICTWVGVKKSLLLLINSLVCHEREREKVREMGCFGDGSCAGNEGEKRAKGRFLNGKGTVTFWAGRWPH